MNVTADSDPLSKSLQTLYEDLLKFRQQVLDKAKVITENNPDYFINGKPSTSAWNLACYTAFREHDLRSLQNRLALAGLSSLGRGESHILSNLDRVIELLARATHKELPANFESCSDQDFKRGIDLIRKRTKQLFGPIRSNRSTRIMVTLPTEAAENE